MPAKKYVLHTDGRIKVVLTPESQINNVYIDEEASQVSQNILENQDDFYSNRSKSIFKASTNFLPSGTKGSISSVSESQILGGNDIETGIISRETPEIAAGKLFPEKKDSNILVNPSFGADTDIKYYRNYNSAFAEMNVNKNIYAEELEMLAGVELNSFGIILSSKGVDITLLLIVFDYILELTTYVAAVLGIMKLSEEIKYARAPIITYFRDLISNNNLFEQIQSRNIFEQLFELNSCFIVGFNEYINTDPKFGYDFSATRNIDIEYSGTKQKYENSALYSYLKNTITSASKIGRNRVFLLIRKFQQESYWHSEILYKAKSSNNKTSYVLGTDSISPENSLDRFFTEFSQYYFKFFIERVYIGRILLNLDSFALKSFKKTQSANLFRNRHYDKGSTEFDSLNSPSSNFGWFSGASGPSKIAIRKLPSLLKSTHYFKHSKLGLTQKNIFGYKKNNIERFDKETVSIIEAHLDAEYMPFYFHDVRTNEIISFYAFLDSITDNFNPEYTSTSGYGRIDDVKHYIKTTRNINLTFNVVPQNSRDYDHMWYKINKIVSLVYPQWSQGIPSNAKDEAGKKIMPENFRFPFTQVPTASPLIRLRVGDVLKSNFSKSAFSRLHGNKVINVTKDDTRSISKVSTSAEGEYFNLEKLYVNIISSIEYDKYSKPRSDIMAHYSSKGSNEAQEMLDLGLLAQYTYHNFYDVRGSLDGDDIPTANNKFSSFDRNKYKRGSMLTEVKEGEHVFYNLYKVGNGDASPGFLKFPYDKPLNVGDNKETTYIINNNYSVADLDRSYTKANSMNKYEIKFKDVTKIIADAQKVEALSKGPMQDDSDIYPWFLARNFKCTIFNYKVSFDEVYNDYDTLTESGFMIFFSKNHEVITTTTTTTTTTENTSARGYKNSVEGLKDIIESESGEKANNPFAKSFESSQGKGLAGFITMLDIGYSDSTWQTDTQGSNAPHTIKVGINFSPIHDISPGIDHEGVLRAPVYPVGNIVNKVFNSDDSDVKVEYKYDINTSTKKSKSIDYK
jgi:hypothetical protein